jgi:ABC-type transporter Mla subunit MlaD
MQVNRVHRRAIGRRRLLGLLVLLGAVLVTVLLWQRPDPFASRETVRANVTDADGLAPIGADVRVAGTPVGKVTGVARSGNVARLTLTLDSDAGVVRRDATIALRPRLMFEGTAYVELKLGSPTAPPLGSGVLPATQSSTYVPLEDALSVLRARTRGDVHTLARTAAGLLRPPATLQLRQTIAAAAPLETDAAVVARAALGPHAGELRTAVSSLGHVASAVAAQSPALTVTLGEAARTAAALDTGSGQPLDESIGALPATAANLNTGATAAATVVGRLQALVPRLQPGVAELTPTLAAIRPVLQRAAPVLSAFSPLLTQIQTALTGARRGASPALAAIGALRPTLGIFKSTLLSALEQRTDLGTPAYLAFLGLFAGGGGASRPFGVGGQGHFMRLGLRYRTGPGQPLPPCTLLAQVSPALATALETAGGCTP